MTLTFPQAPRFIPDSRICPAIAGLATMAFPQPAFRICRKLKCWHNIQPSTYWFTVRLVLRILFPTLLRHRVPKWFLLNTAIRREPLCPNSGVTYFWHDVLHHVRWSYPSFIAHTGSCARTNSSRRLRFNYYNRSLQVVTPAPAGLGDGPSRHYLYNPCVGAWTPTPQCLSGALARFFPEGNGLTSNVTRSAH